MIEKPMLNAKCPKCEETITQVSSSTVDIKVPFGASKKGMSYFCPSCQTLLSVQIDPNTFKSELINELIAKLPRQKL